MRWYRMLLRLVILALGGMPVVFAENVYKCTDHNGGVVYQKERCQDARQAEEKQIDPNKNVIPWELPPPSSARTDSTPSTSTPSGAARPPSGEVHKRRGGY